MVKTAWLKFESKILLHICDTYHCDYQPHTTFCFTYRFSVKYGFSFSILRFTLRGVEWVHGLFLFPLVFGENVVATCKIGSFLCSLDNLLQKNVIVLFLKIKFQNGARLKKGLFLTYFSHFLVTRESYKNSFSTYLTHIHTRILLTLLTFFALPILKKIRIYQIRFLFGMSPGVDSYSRHFGTINK